MIHVRKQVPLGTDRNGSVRYSITSEVPATSSSSTLQTLPPQPVIINQHRPVPRGPQSAAGGPRPGLRPLQRIAPAQGPSMPPRMGNSLRPTALSRSLPPPNIVGVRPPPLIISGATSLNSSVRMPSAGAMQSLAGGGHLGFQQAQMQLQQQMLRQQNPNSAIRMPSNGNGGAGPMSVAPTQMAAGPPTPLPRVYGNDPVGKVRKI